MAAALAGLSSRMTPTINMQTPGPELEVIAEAIKKDQNGVCLRIAEDDMEDDLIFRNMVNQLLENLDVSFDSVDLIIDLAYKPEPVKPLYVRSLINDIIFNHSRWRTFTLTCTSFPVNMSEIERDSLEALYRIEWDLWEKLLAHHASNRLERMPAYSDYCVANPEAIEIDPKLMNPSGHIRYTIQDEFLIVKGGAVRDVKRGGVVVAKGRKYAQMVGLCKTLINRPEFCGSGFSWGDQYIQDCANGIVSHGNPETWRRVATNHHLTFVVDQLANYPALSAAQQTMGFAAAHMQTELQTARAILHPDPLAMPSSDPDAPEQTCFTSNVLIFRNFTGDIIFYYYDKVIYLYILNMTMVGIDILLYIRNRRLQSKA